MAINPNNLSQTAHLTFADEFNSFQTWNGNSGLDTTGGPQWAGRVSASGTLPYNNELEWYVPASGGSALPNPFSISNGILDLTAQPADAALRASIQGQSYTSGMITTNHEFSQTYGYFEMRAQMPKGQGLWPAFWLLPEDGSWPPELDVMEMLGNQTSTLHTTVHSQTGGQDQLSATHFQTTDAVAVADMSTGFHTYGVDWEPDTITWYFDGREVFKAATPADMHKPMYMVANLAVGGDWPGSPDASTLFPATMQIDYLRAYAADPGLNVPPITAPRTVEPNDLTYSSTASGYNHFIDLLNFEASYTDLLHAFGTNQASMQNWYSTFEPNERRIETFDGLDYIASYGDLINAFRSAGSMRAVQDAGATHFINYGSNEGRSTTFNGLDYIASYGDLIAAFGADNDAGAYHFIEFGANEHRSITFDGLDYIASYGDLRQAFGANAQAGAAHFIDFGNREGRTTTFDGLSYIAQYTDLMTAFGANNDAGASHYITYGANEGRSTGFNVAAYELAHPDLIGKYASNDAFLAAYINTYTATGTYLT